MKRILAFVASFLLAVGGIIGAEASQVTIPTPTVEPTKAPDETYLSGLHFVDFNYDWSADLPEGPFTIIFTPGLHGFRLDSLFFSDAKIYVHVTQLNNPDEDYRSADDSNGDGKYTADECVKYEQSGEDTLDLEHVLGGDGNPLEYWSDTYSWSVFKADNSNHERYLEFAGCKPLVAGLSAVRIVGQMWDSPDALHFFNSSILPTVTYLFAHLKIAANGDDIGTPPAEGSPAA